jgi:hypothetical protein
VISDNASPDDTGAVVARFAEQLPIRYIRHDENIGCFANVQFVMMQALGRYVIYLSTTTACSASRSPPRSRRWKPPRRRGRLRPWKLYDLVAQQEQGQFYDVPQDLRSRRTAMRSCSTTCCAITSFPRSTSPAATRCSG